MSKSKVNPPIIRKNSLGLLETVDPLSGEIISTQKPNSRLQKRIDKGEPMKVKRALVNEFDAWQYTQPLHERIVGLRLQGLSYSEMSKLDGIPPGHVIFYWRRKHPEFAIDLGNARKDRAEYFYDKVEEIANSNWEKNEVPNARLRGQLYQWLAERGSPDEFSSKIKPDEGLSQPQIIQIVTGVPDSNEQDHPLVY